MPRRNVTSPLPQISSSDEVVLQPVGQHRLAPRAAARPARRLDARCSLRLRCGRREGRLRRDPRRRPAARGAPVARAESRALDARQRRQQRRTRRSCRRGRCSRRSRRRSLHRAFDVGRELQLRVRQIAIRSARAPSPRPRAVDARRAGTAQQHGVSWKRARPIC